MSTMTRTIAIDSGKFATKVSMAAGIGTIDHLSFKTQMTEGVEKVDVGGDGTFSVEFEGKKYLVGDQARGQSFDRSKQNDLHRISTYVGVAMMMKKAGGFNDNVKLAIGCPLSIYINQDARQRYKDFIAPAGKRVVIKVDGIEYTFTIVASYVFPESSGVIYLNSSKYRDGIVGVIDIGGLNANCCIYDKLVPKYGADSMFTLEMGGNILTSNIMTSLESEFNTSIPELFYDQVMRDGCIKIDKEASARRIEELKVEHVRAIMTECKRHKWATDLMDVVFTGGTSFLLKDEIQKVFPTAIIDHLDSEACFKNADGFLQQLLVKTGQAIYIGQ